MLKCRVRQLDQLKTFFSVVKNVNVREKQKKKCIERISFVFYSNFSTIEERKKKNFIQIEKTKRIAYKIDIHHMTFCQQRNNSMLEF